MELEQLYQIGAVVEETENFVVEVALFRESVIFDAHFPGNPILPGACITDIVKCCAEKVVNRSLEIKSVRNLKFLQIIQPDNVANLKITLKISSANDELVCKAIVASDAIVFSKMDLYLISRS
ncbi:MAG: hypothetical protein U0L67_02115 [Paludibacteraceae bacterium]|jgi:3-hydroxyacyl-[acyl-carrier-protein] dehydratase|nr:hypothetical protein [Paludibacteraceae bacterium]